MSPLHRTRPAPLPAHLAKARTDERALTLTSVLSAPYPDLAGDIVSPDGLDWAPHARDPAIDFEHRRDPGVRSRPVAWARPTLAEAGPYHSPVYSRLNFGTDAAPEWHRVPVGTEWFDPADRVSAQVFALCCADALPGRSLEFSPVEGYAKALGRSPIESRSAYHFLKARVHRWTVCARPVCEQALQTVGKAAPVPPGDAMLRVLRDRRVNVGGSWEPLCPYLLKALAPPAPAKRTTARVETKAMDYEAPADPDTTTALEAGTEGPEDTGPPAKPTVQAHYDVAQSILDAIESGKAALESSEHVKGRQFLLKKLDQLEALAQDIKGMGDKIDAELGGHDEPDGDEGDADEPTDADISTDDDGVMKAVRPTYYKALKGKRFSAAEIKKGQDADPEQIKHLMARADRAAKTIRTHS